MRVLLVEDDPTTSRSIELMLTHANFNVYCTDLGEEAVELAIAAVQGDNARTVSEAAAASEAASTAGWGRLVSARSGESEDVSIVHLATGWNAGQIKVGSFARSERMAKWNELLRIEEALGNAAVFAGWDALPAQVVRR